MFDYYLPAERIAKYPANPPDSCNLLIYYRDSDKIIDEKFFNLPFYLDSNFIVVFNETKVQPVRIEYEIADIKDLQEKTKDKIRRKDLSSDISYGNVLTNLEQSTKRKISDFIIYNIINEREVEILTKLSRSSFPISVYKGDEEIGYIVGRAEFGYKLILEENVNKLIEKYGTMPIPPYLKRRAEEGDYKWYQTIFAKKGSSIAAPTASLHFTDNIVSKVRERNIEIFFLRLDIHFSTIFERARIPSTILGEYYEIKESDFTMILKRKKEGKKVIAVGTTVCKALETVAFSGKLSGISELYIKPPFEFKITDCLITNFHMSRSPTLELVCAFAGIDKTKKIYKHALDNKYKFLSYGDAMFIC